MTVHVSAPTRLHFGLLRVQHPFGGLGTMLESPRVDVSVEPGTDEKSSFEGTLADRARSFWQTFKLSMPEISRSFLIRADGPAEHTGLGVGTALGMALCRAILNLHHRETASNNECRLLSGRGHRSQIGVHGFSTGGFLFDRGHGHTPESIRFPRAWRFGLLAAAGVSPWHGDRERDAFKSLQATELSHHLTKTLLGLVDQSLLPAIAAQDFPAFTAALANYNRLAGRFFADLQSGDYADPATARLIDDLQQQGFTGCGQSSWGPTVFIPIADDASEQALQNFANERNLTLRVSSVAGCGAIVTQSD